MTAPTTVQARPSPQARRCVALFVLLSAALALPVAYSVATSYQAARREAATEPHTMAGAGALQKWRRDSFILIAITLLAEVVNGVDLVGRGRSDARRRRIESQLRRSDERPSSFV